MTTPGPPFPNDSDVADRERAGNRARLFFDDLWTQGDYWRLETCEFDQSGYARSLQLLSDRRYPRTLEIGCGAGAFTRLLASMSDHVVGLDVSPAAIDRARGQVADPGVEFRVANVMDAAPETEGPWDLIVMNETVYYLQPRPVAAASCWRTPSAMTSGICSGPG